MNDLALAVIWLGLFSTVFFSWYFYLQARTKERTMLIEKGADASNFYGKKPERKGFTFPWLKFGLLLVGISFGLTLSTIVEPFLPSSIDAEPMIFGSTVLFGGMGMVLAHFTDKKRVQ
ncbi:DUF6249 domain-containing protein [Carboxylicivirga sp. M1479]|uniref:DUF6249 domain-containing protein n=1 Tax=Carboxylicivirga sp. M1479 TaxID=2594476 RepID=UPI001177D8FD|nr:DUF6249 domain-containing protein [Carboxylicivirga sp. M1479]TRX66337.1 hypothetical protein FNN09_14110 [Carboxylicivirga sp. M1479]